MATTPRLGGTLLTLAQANAEVTANELFTLIDGALAIELQDRDLSSEPGGESAGEMWLVSGTGSGDWVGEDGNIALKTSGGWRFFPPLGGMVAYVEDEAIWIQYSGSAWSSMLTADSSRWVVIASNRYTTPPATTSTITMSDTTGLTPGLPLKIENGGTKYVLITAVTTDTSITVMGMALATGSAITELAVGTPEMVKQLNFFVAGVYADATDTDLLGNHMNSAYRWAGGAHYVAMIEVTHKTVDTGTEPKVNLLAGGSKVSTEDTNNGLQLGASLTWIRSAVATMHATQNKVEFGDALTPEVTAAGGTGDAEDLTMQVTLIAE